MKKSTVVLFVSLIVLFVGCSANNSSNPMLDPIPEKGENPLPLMPNADFTKIFKQPVDSLRAKSNNYVDLNQLKPLLERAQKELGEDHVAVFSLKDSTGSWYSYYVEKLIFPDSLISKANSKTIPYLFYEENVDGNPPRIAIALIPANSEAFESFDDWIKPNVNTDRNENLKFKGCTYEKVSGGYWTCAEDDITGESFCGYYPEQYDWVCTDSEPEVYEWPSTGGGGFGSTPSPSCEDNSLTPEPGCDCPSGTVMSTDGVCVVELETTFLGDITIDASIVNDPKTKCVLNKLFYNGNTLTNTIIKFAKESVDLDLLIKLGEDEADDPGSLMHSPSSNEFTLLIDKSRSQDRLPIQIATTIMHEAIHAEMRRYLFDSPGTSTLPGFPSNFGDDWEAYINKQYGAEFEDQLGYAEHNAMAKHYVNIISAGLSEFDNSSLTDDEYEALAWEGLTGTYAYGQKNYDEKKELSDNYNNAINSSSETCN